MKKTTFSLLLSLACCHWLAAQCPTGDITFSTQGQIDSFPINHPGCTDMPWSVTIEETSTGNIVNLAGLSQIDSIGGYLTIEDNDALPNLNELKNLKYLGRGLAIIDNDSLTSLAGLENLDSVGCLRIQNNHALKSLVGLDHISAIGGCYVNGGDFGYNGGGLIINGNNALTSMTGLNNLVSIAGCFKIENNPALTSMTGLEKLVFIGGECGWQAGSQGSYIINNPTLSTLKGLNRLTSISRIRISDNSALTSVDELSNLSSVESTLNISNNASLTAIGGLDSLTSVGYALDIYNNTALTSISGLDNLTQVGNLTISNNGALTSLTGFDSLRVINYSFTLKGNGVLTDLSGFGQLDTIRQSFRLENNASLTGFDGLEQLDFIGGFCLQNDCRGFFVANNAALTSFNALKSLDRVMGIFEVKGNASLSSFAGLERLRIGRNQNVKGKLNIAGNPQLERLKDLDSLDFTTIADIDILNNANLYICHTPPICAYLQNGGPATISNNAPGCNNIPEVKMACLVPTGETGPTGPPLQISPNPATDFLQIQIDGLEKWDISLFDLQGRLLYRQAVSGNQSIDVADWPAGLYALRAVSGGRVYAGRFVK